MATKSAPKSDDDETPRAADGTTFAESFKKFLSDKKRRNALNLAECGKKIVKREQCLPCWYGLHPYDPESAEHFKSGGDKMLPHAVTRALVAHRLQVAKTSEKSSNALIEMGFEHSVDVKEEVAWEPPSSSTTLCHVSCKVWNVLAYNEKGAEHLWAMFAEKLSK